MEVIVWGGAGEHGRSCYYIENEGKSILLDCGGKKEQGGIYPFLDEKKVSELDAVFLSHAHEDHSIALPLLYKFGFTGDVWTSRATVNQLPFYFEAWIKFVQKNGGKLPYEVNDIERIKFRYFEESSTPLNWFELMPGICVRWGASGHMVGSVWMQFELNGKKVFYSGDYCAQPILLYTDLPYAEIESDRNSNPMDLAIIDAAYGLDAHTQEECIFQLMSKIGEVLNRGGHVLLPVPLFGRGQDLVVLVRERFQEVPIAVEEEILKGFVYYKSHSKWLREGAIMQINELSTLNQCISLTTVCDRLTVLQSQQPHIIFTTDGMLKSEKAKWYYEQLYHNPLHAILFTGHVSKDSRNAPVSEFDKCEVSNYRFKIHQGGSDVNTMLTHMVSKKTILAHSTKEKTDNLRDELINFGFHNVYSLLPGENIEV